MKKTQPQKNIFLKSPYFNNFNVESVATVKGLKLVSSGYFPDTTMKKITSANESDIDSLQISATTKTIFHTAIADGHTIFTPTKSVTYGQWQGLFYITTNFNDEASYIIGEGLNGGYTTIEQFPGGIDNILRRNAVTLGVTANIISPANNSTYEKGDIIHWVANYNFLSLGTVWTEKKEIITAQAKPGTYFLRSGYGTLSTRVVNITGHEIGTPGAGGNNTFTYDDLITKYMNQVDLPPGILKTMISKESANKNESTRYEPCKDIQYKADGKYDLTPYKYWVIGDSGGLTTGDGARDFSQNNYKGFSPKKMIDEFSLKNFTMPASAVPTVYEVWNANRNFYSSNCKNVDSVEGNYPAQFIIATSYGLGQILYTSAIEQGFNKIPGTQTDFTIPKNPWSLLTLEENIKNAAIHLKGKYDSAVSSSDVGYPGKICSYQDTYSNQYFKNTYGTNWVEVLAAWPGQSAEWTTLKNQLSTAKDDLWWAVRWYVGDNAKTIKDANDRCGAYHNQ